MSDPAAAFSEIAAAARAIRICSRRARAAWASAHGMALLEITNRFPPGADIDAAWRVGIGAFRHG